MAYSEKKPHLSVTEKGQRKPSVVVSIAGGSQTTNILQSAVQVENPSLVGEHSTTFASKGLDAYYRPSQHWEGLHRYDPKFAWEPSEEKALARKLDWRICSFACLMFFALQ